LSDSRDQSKVLVIDDEDIVRRSFCDSLEDLGYLVLDAKNGSQGLSIIESEQPDVILTDLRMPLMGGVEFLKQCQEAKFDIPIIVISGVGSMNDVVQAIHLGAFDFLTKPIRESSLLQATVERALNQVKLKRENENYQLHLEHLVEHRTRALHESNQELAKHKDDLEQLVDERTQELRVVIDSLHEAQGQLIESAKMASLGRLVAGVSHELNTPLGICLTFITSLEDKVVKFEQDYFNAKINRDKFESFLASTRESSTIVLNYLNQACELVRNFKLISVDVSNDMKREFDLTDYFNSVVRSLSAEIHHHQVEITCLSKQKIIINSYPGIFSQILTNLILNSLTHAFSKESVAKITVTLDVADNHLIIKYIDNGKGMSEETKQQIFEPFFTTARGTGGSGLGMNIIYSLVVGNLSGSILCDSAIGKGTAFTIKLPELL
jgi:signal transduction histidine kinase